MIWDEADLCTSSETRDEKKLENAVFQVPRFSGMWEGKRSLPCTLETQTDFVCSHIFLVSVSFASTFQAEGR